jgi:hypothetical protein
VIQKPEQEIRLVAPEQRPENLLHAGDRIWNSPHRGYALERFHLSRQKKKNLSLHFWAKWE